MHYALRTTHFPTMHQTLFYIPEKLFGIPVFGFGLLLFIWLIITGISMILDYRKSGLKSVWSFLIVMGFGAAAIVWVLPNIVKPAGLPIQSYGAMMLLGIVSGLLLGVYRAKKYGYSPDLIISMVLWMCILGIIGARVFFCIEYWSVMKSDTWAETIRKCLNFTEGGLVVYGSLFGGLLGIVCFILTAPNPNEETEHKKRLSIWRMLDIIAPSMVLGLALGRIGCFLNGCCFGGVCDVDKYPWAVTFPAGSPPFMAQVEQGLISLDNQPLQGLTLEKVYFPEKNWRIVVKSVEKNSAAEKAGMKPNDVLLKINDFPIVNKENYKDGDAQLGIAYYCLTAGARTEGTVTVQTENNPSISWKYDSSHELRSLPVHPTQLYSSLNALLLLVILLIFDRFQHWEGATFLLLVTLYPITRWILEAIRIDESGAFGTSMSISQLVSLIMLPIVCLLWGYLWFSNRGKAVGSRE